MGLYLLTIHPAHRIVFANSNHFSSCDYDIIRKRVIAHFHSAFLEIEEVVSLVEISCNMSAKDIQFLYHQISIWNHSNHPGTSPHWNHFPTHSVGWPPPLYYWHSTLTSPWALLPGIECFTFLLRTMPVCWPCQYSAEYLWFCVSSWQIFITYHLKKIMPNIRNSLTSFFNISMTPFYTLQLTFEHLYLHLVATISLLKKIPYPTYHLPKFLPSRYGTKFYTKMWIHVNFDLFLVFDRLKLFAKPWRIPLNSLEWLSNILCTNILKLVFLSSMVNASMKVYPLIDSMSTAQTSFPVLHLHIYFMVYTPPTFKSMDIYLVAIDSTIAIANFALIMVSQQLSVVTMTGKDTMENPLASIENSLSKMNFLNHTTNNKMLLNPVAYDGSSLQFMFF